MKRNSSPLYLNWFIVLSNQAPVYHERATTLIGEIKLLLSSEMKDGCKDSDHDLIKRLQIVDTIECLGIDRHFQPEIKVALDYVYRLIYG